MENAVEGPLGGLERARLAQITAQIVALYRQHYGKGPTKAKTEMVADTIICELEDFSTTVERTLVEHGHHDQVQDLRLKFQDALGDEFTEVVEGVTGRKVRVFMSQSCIEPELALEIFLLEPENTGR